MVFKALFLISLSLWIGGSAFFAAVVTPAAFRSLGKEEVGRFLAAIFPAADRWACVCGAVAVLSLYPIFLDRHLETSSLVLELPVLFGLLLTCHNTLIVHPQIRELKRKMNLPEFQGTSHYQTIQFAFGRMHRLSVRLYLGALLLGLLSLGLTPAALK